MATKAYSYIRFSTGEQRHGDSLRRQLEQARRYAAQHGMELDDSLRDLGRSAFKDLNTDGALDRFLELIKSDEVKRGSVLLVENLDRLSRKRVVTALRQFLNILHAGVDIVTLSDGQRYSDNCDVGELNFSIFQMANAHVESQKKSVRILADWERQKTLARVEKRPIGGGTKPGWIRLVDGKFELIPERVGVLHEIFEWTAAGVGRQGITHRLNQRDEPTWSGRAKNGWHDSYISKLLSSRLVLGEYQPMKMVDGKIVTDGPAIKDYYPAAIDLKLYNRAKLAVAKRLTARGRHGKGLSNLLIGLVKCAHCGSSMKYVSKGGQSKPKLICYNYWRRAGCDIDRRYTYEEVERDVLFALGRQTVERLIDSSESIQDEIDHEITRLELVISESKRKRAVLLGALDDGEEDEQITIELKKYSARIKTAKAELDDLRKKKVEIEDFSGVERRVDLIDRLNKSLEEATPEEVYDRRLEIAQHLRSLISSVRLHSSNRGFPVLIDFLDGSFAAVTHKDGLPVDFHYKSTGLIDFDEDGPRELTAEDEFELYRPMPGGTRRKPGL